MSEQSITIIISFIGGLGLFIFGMHTMAEGLQKAAGSKMKKLLEALTNNRLLGVAVGAFVTAIIQSSSATTVMVVGFVNAGLMNLTQAYGIIMGANIGTTATGWIVASADWAKYLKPETMAPVAIAIGVIMMMTAKKSTTKHIAEIIIGFGILFIGIGTMSQAVSPLRESKVFRDLFVLLGSNPLLGILAGTVVTAIIQSSSASVGILQTLAQAGLVPWNAAVYIVMGQNIGTCATAMLSSIGASKNAKSAAYMHLLFNIIGSLVFSVMAVAYFTIFNKTIGYTLISMTQIGIVHTMFNVFNTVLLFNFANVIIFLAKKIAKVDDSPVDEAGFVHLDDRMLETPSFAVQNSVKEVVRMGNLVSESMHLSMDAIINNNVVNIEKIMQRERNLDSLRDGITNYLIKVCNTNINDLERRTVLTLLNTVSDIERIGDHLENIAEFAQYMVDSKLAFSDMAKDELREIITLALSCFENSILYLESNNFSLCDTVFIQEDAVDLLEERYRETHISRLANGLCNSTSGVIFLDVLTNVERIADHAFTIARNTARLTHAI